MLKCRFRRGNRPLGPPLFLEMADLFGTRGLKWRSYLAYDSGMLFNFSEDADHIFWMKDTYLPLDLIYLDSAYKVVGYIENAVPQSEEYLGVGIASKFVVEINAGWVKREEIKVGDELVFENKYI